MKKVLVISNSSFSLVSSNGRTLAKLFDGYNPDCLAQFCTHGEPDFSVCNNFYKVSDKQALMSFIKRRAYGGVVERKEPEETVSNPSTLGERPSKTPFKMLLRELAWKYGKWCSKDFLSWVENFAPEEILVFAGDNAFLLNLALKLKKKFDASVILYSTEDYCFKDYNYITRKKSLFYKIFHNNLLKTYKRLAPEVRLGIFNSPMLTKQYKKAFSFKCKTLYARSDIEFIARDEKTNMSDLKVSYLGNLGLDRHIPLMEIADTLAEIIPGAKLTVYGAASEKVLDAFNSNPNVDFKGFIDYGEVVNVIHSSDLLVHAEKNDPFYTKDLQMAFSTKIADSVCSGTPFFMYADKNLAGTDFLIKNKCAFVATEKGKLKKVLKAALTDESKRKKVVEAAKSVREKSFCSKVTLASLIND